MIVRKAVFNRFLKRLSQTEKFPLEDLGRDEEGSSSESPMASAGADPERSMSETDLTVDAEVKNP